jgi:hypothetical protein
MLAPLMLPEWQFELLRHRLEFLRASGKLVSFARRVVEGGGWLHWWVVWGGPAASRFCVWGAKGLGKRDGGWPH